MDLKIITYNCQSYNSNSGIIKNLLSVCDILCIQESLISNSNSYLLNSIDDDFDFVLNDAVRDLDQFSGRSSGGLITFWKKSIDMRCVPVVINNRCLGLKLINDDISYLLLNVYFNCDYGNLESLLKYRENLAEISEFLSEYDFDELLLIGDMNADPNKGRFFQDLSNFANVFDLNMYDVECLPIDSFTFLSRNQACTTSWLDHILCSNDSIVSDCQILYSQAIIDHMPLKFSLKIPNLSSHLEYITNRRTGQDVIHYDWNSGINREIFMYKLDILSSEFHCDLFSCSGNCHDPVHRVELDRMYTDINNIIISASKHMRKDYSGQKFKKIVGWNDYVQDLHNVARANFLNWIDSGRPRFGLIFEDMKGSRRDFKKALDFCKRNELKLRKDKFLSLYSCSKKTVFWKEIRKLTVRKHGSNINGSNDPEEINDMFYTQFSSGSDNSVIDPFVCNIPQSHEIVLDNKKYFTASDLDNAINRLNKSIGHDGFSFEHLVNAGPSFRNLLLKFFNSCINHSFLPLDMLHGEIRPIIKDKKICKSKLQNYRPIMNSSVFLKVFEYLLLPILRKYLSPIDQQVGFTPHSSCTNSITLLKEVVLNYNADDSEVYCAFMDLSKAFDNINHKILIDKLLKTDLPRMLVNILSAMFQNTYAHVKFDNIHGNPWRITSGTRQGGILSPLLFNFYLRSLVEEIAKLDVGCRLDVLKFNILVYADDIILLAPSRSGLQILINKLYDCLSEINLEVNPVKSKYMIFSSKKRAYSNVPVFYDSVPLEYVNEMKYLGIILSTNLNVNKDTDRALNAF